MCKILLYQSEPIPAVANPDGSIEVLIKADGTDVKITFEPASPTETIVVGPIDVKACSEPSKSSLFSMVELTYTHASITKYQ